MTTINCKKLKSVGDKDYYKITVFDGIEKIEFECFIDDDCRLNNLFAMDKEEIEIIKKSKFDELKVYNLVLEEFADKKIIGSPKLNNDYQKALDEMMGMNRSERRKYIKDFEKRTGKKISKELINSTIERRRLN
jgi:hypothetical protein